MARVNYAANPRTRGSDRYLGYYEAGKATATAFTGAGGLPISYIDSYRRVETTAVATVERQFGQALYTDRDDFPHRKGDFYWNRIYVRTNQSLVQLGHWYVERSWNGAAYVNTAATYVEFGVFGSGSGWVEIEYLNYIHFDTTESFMIIPVIETLDGVGFLPVGSQLDVHAHMIEREPFTGTAYESRLYEGFTEMSDHFDGTTPTTDDETFAWSGTADLSISRSTDRWQATNTGAGKTHLAEITVANSGGTAGTAATAITPGGGAFVSPHWSAFPDVLGSNRAMSTQYHANISWNTANRKYVTGHFRFMFESGTDEFTLFWANMGGGTPTMLVRTTITSDGRFKIYDMNGTTLFTSSSFTLLQPDIWYQCAFGLGAETVPPTDDDGIWYQNVDISVYNDDDSSPGGWLYEGRVKTINTGTTIPNITLGAHTSFDISNSRERHYAEFTVRGMSVLTSFFGDIPLTGRAVVKLNGSLDVTTRAYGENTTSEAPLTVVPATPNAPGADSLSYTLPVITNRSLLIVMAYSKDFRQDTGHDIVGMTYDLSGATPTPDVWDLAGYPIDVTTGGHDPTSEAFNEWTVDDPNEVGILRWGFIVDDTNSEQVFTLTRDPEEIDEFAMQVTVINGVGDGDVVGFMNVSGNTQYHGNGGISRTPVRDLAADALAGPGRMGLVEYQMSLWRPASTMWPGGLWGDAAYMIALNPYGMTPLPSTSGAQSQTTIEIPDDFRTWVINTYPGSTRGPYNPATASQVIWEPRISRAELEASTGYFGLEWWSVWTIAVPIGGVATGQLPLAVGLTGTGIPTGSKNVVPTVGLVGSVAQEISRTGSIPVTAKLVGRNPVIRTGDAPASVELTAEASVQSPLYLYTELDHDMHFDGSFSVDIATTGLIPSVSVTGEIAIPADVIGRVPPRPFPAPKDLDLIPVTQDLSLEPLPEELEQYAVTGEITLDQIGYWRNP